MTTNNKILHHLKRWVKEYLPDGEGRKENTIQSYKDTWRLIIKFFEKDGIKADDITYEMLTYDCLMNFFSWIEKDRGCSISTRNNRLSAISKFAKYSVQQDFAVTVTFSNAVSKLPYKKKSEEDITERAYFEKEELRLFLDCPTPKSSMGIRDHVLLIFMYASGMRAKEVCISKMRDIRFLSDGKASILVHGKGGKNRRIKIFEEAAEVLKKYIYYRRIENQSDAFIFPSQRNERMSLKCLEEIFAKYVRIARRENPSLFQRGSYTPHSMRHTTAMHMLDAGVPLVVIKQFLGHAHLSTTEIYAKLSPSAVNQKLENWSREYWDQYMDEAFNSTDTFENPSNIPDFLS